MKRTINFLLLLCLTFCLSACGVPQEDYDALTKENSSLQEQVESLQAELELLSKRNQTLEKRIEKLQSESFEPEESVASESSNAIENYKQEKEASANAPRDTEVVAYAETVLTDFYPDSKFPFDAINEYEIVKTNLRYKIEGTFKENKKSSYEDFCMIIEFLDNQYETYDLVSLQVGKETVYKLQN